MKRIPIALLIATAISSTAHAGAIISAVSGTINSGGPGDGTLTETFNQAGLSAGYSSGVTDFDTYIGSGPTHTTNFPGDEWFSNRGSTSASVTYDLGAIVTIDAMALWNEESSGIGLLDLLGSTDGITFFALASALAPTDNPYGSDYSADVFGFASTSLRYVRLDMSSCPQIPSTYAACAIGEVAFRSAEAVPEPAALGLLSIGLIGLGAARRRKSA